MASILKKDESIFIPMRNGLSISNSQLRPRMYKSPKAFKRSFSDCYLETEGIELVEYAPVRHGRWVLGRVEPGYCTPGGNRPWICSECGKVASWKLNKPTKKWCDECGAMMDKEES